MPYYKHPNTLREVRNKARAHRAEYNRLFKKVEVDRYGSYSHQESVDRKAANLKGEWGSRLQEEHPDRYKREVEELGGMAIRLENIKNHTYSKKQAEEARAHFMQNEAAYYDLALMDAHIDGVAITTPQPLQVGQKPGPYQPKLF